MDYHPQSELEKLQELFNSGFITEYEFNKRRKELDESNHNINDNNNNQYSNNYSYNYNSTTSSNYDYNQVIPVIYEDNNNTTYNNFNDYSSTSSTSTYDYNNYNSTSAYDYNQIIPVTYDNNDSSSTSINDYNNYNSTSSTYDYNQITPVTYENDTIYSSNNDNFNQNNNFSHDNNNNNYNQNIYNNYNSDNNKSNKSNKDVEEYDDTYVINIKPPIQKKSFAIESKNVNKELANRKVEYPLKLKEGTIYKDIGNNFVLYTKGRQGNHQSELITLEGKSESDVFECMKNFIGIKDTVNCHFIIFKLVIYSEIKHPSLECSNYKFEDYRVQIFPGDKELLKPNHFLLEYASYPIHRSNWNPSTHYSYPHYFSQSIDKFTGFPTKTDTYDYSKLKNDFPMRASTSQQFKIKYNKINFILLYRHLQDLSSNWPYFSTLKKEYITNVTERIKNSINNGTCAMCNELVYINQSFLCSNHHNSKLISAYESFVYLNNSESLDETIDTVSEVLSNQQIKYEEEVKELVINKEKFKLLEPEQLVEFSKRKGCGLASFISEKIKNIDNENYDENKIENNFKEDYSTQYSSYNSSQYSDYYY